MRPGSAARIGHPAAHRDPARPGLFCLRSLAVAAGPLPPCVPGAFATLTWLLTAVAGLPYASPAAILASSLRGKFSYAVSQSDV